jgi:hypothetical protein
MRRAGDAHGRTRTTTGGGFEEVVRRRSIVLAIAVVAAATLCVSTAAFADTLTVTFTGYPTVSGNTLHGSQTTTTSQSTTAYSGTYDATGTYNSRTKCVNNPLTVLYFGKINGVDSSLTLNLQNPLCIAGSNGTINFTAVSGTGFFKNASGSGTATYVAPYSVVFTDTGGSFFSPLGGGGLANTPELDSILLFGSGALGLAGYAFMRARAARGRRSAD